MINKKASLDDFLNDGTEKTASKAVPIDTKGDILQKLADINSEMNKEAAEGDKPGEGTVAVENDTIAQPSAEVTKQTDAVIDEQLAIDSPGANEEQAAGDKSVTNTGAKPVVSSTGGGEIKPSADVSVEPVSAEAAKKPTNKTATKDEDYSDPKIWAKVAARELNTELEKIANEKEVFEAAVFLKSAGLLQGYKIDGIEKTAGVFENEEEAAGEIFQKMAKFEELSNDEILCAAEVYGEALKKESEAQYQEQLEKEAAESLEAEQLEKEAADRVIIEKFASNKEVMSAVEILQKNNLLPE